MSVESKSQKSSIVAGLGLPTSRRTSSTNFSENPISYSFEQMTYSFACSAEIGPATGSLVDLQRLGSRALLDTESRAYRDQGLAYLSMGDDEILERLLEDPRLLRLPMVRAGDRFSAGPAEPTWKAWLVP